MSAEVTLSNSVTHLLAEALAVAARHSCGELCCRTLGAGGHERRQGFACISRTLLVTNGSSGEGPKTLPPKAPITNNLHYFDRLHTHSLPGKVASLALNLTRIPISQLNAPHANMKRWVGRARHKLAFHISSEAVTLHL